MKSATPLKRYLPTSITLIAGIVLSTVASGMVWQWEYSQLQNQFKIRADKFANTLDQSIISSLEGIEQTANFDKADEKVGLEDFQLFARPTLATSPGLRVLSWIQRVSDRERQRFEAKVQKEQPNFQIKERSTNGPFVKAQRRPEYFPITYGVSVARNLPVGFDLASESLCWEAMQAARDTNTMVATRPLSLISNNQLGFLVFQPIYHRGLPTETQQQRRQHLKGYIQGALVISDTIKMALEIVDLDAIDFYMIDTTDSNLQQALAFYNSQTKQMTLLPDLPPAGHLSQSSLCQPLERCQRQIGEAGRQWSIVFVPTRQYVGITSHWRGALILVIGLLWTGIPVTYMLASLRHTTRIEKLAKEQAEQAQKLSQTLKELKEAQTQLIQSEKMSSLGQMVAGIAHEINNPVSFIYSNLSHADDYIRDLLKLIQLYQKNGVPTSPEINEYFEAVDFDFILEDLPKLLTSMKVGADRIRDIVRSLRTFSRLDEAEMKPVELHEGIDSTLMILKHRLQGTGIEIIKDYSQLPLVECYAGQLNQVFMNILSNAIDALEESFSKGDLVQHQDRSLIQIHTALENSETIVVTISDNGVGIAPEAKKRIFDPFFTTKPVGSGTGLGLAISYQIIVEKHGGSLSCESWPGKGTAFRIELPVFQ